MGTTYADGYVRASEANALALERLAEASGREAATLRTRSPSSRASAAADARSEALSEAAALCRAAARARPGPRDVERAVDAVRQVLSAYGVDLLALRSASRAVPGQDPREAERGVVAGALEEAYLQEIGAASASGVDARLRSAERGFVAALDSNPHTQAVSLYWTFGDATLTTRALAAAALVARDHAPEEPVPGPTLR